VIQCSLVTNVSLVSSFELNNASASRDRKTVLCALFVWKLSFYSRFCIYKDHGTVLWPFFCEALWAKLCSWNSSKLRTDHYVYLHYPVCFNPFISYTNHQQPCRRCQREQRECVLGESHRGGRRVRKKPKTDDGTSSSPGPGLPLPSIQTQESRTEQKLNYAQQAQSGPAMPNQHYSNPYDPRFGWQNSASSAIVSPVTSSYSRSTDQASPSITTYPPQTLSQSNPEPKASLRVPVRESIAIASADLQNPSDALDILARVADRAEDDSAGSGMGNTPRPNHVAPGAWLSPPSPAKLNDHLYYKPVNAGLITAELVYELFLV
jgi:hypothetical protein